MFKIFKKKEKIKEKVDLDYYSESLFIETFDNGGFISQKYFYHLMETNKFYDDILKIGNRYFLGESYTIPASYTLKFRVQEIKLMDSTVVTRYRFKSPAGSNCNVKTVYAE